MSGQPRKVLGTIAGLLSLVLIAAGGGTLI